MKMTLSLLEAVLGAVFGEFLWLKLRIILKAKSKEDRVSFYWNLIFIYRFFLNEDRSVIIDNYFDDNSFLSEFARVVFSSTTRNSALEVKNILSATGEALIHIPICLRETSFDLSTAAAPQLEVHVWYRILWCHICFYLFYTCVILIVFFLIAYHLLSSFYLVFFLSFFSNPSLHWGCKINRLQLCKGVSSPTNPTSVLDVIKQFDGEAPALEIWGMRSTPSLLSLPSQL